MDAPLSAITRSPEQTRIVGRALGEVLQAKDLIMLRGGLGTGKTTFTQGIEERMGVRGRVVSPTFIVARVHHSLSGDPGLIHADAYRIRNLENLKTFDLDSSLADPVIVVEWGERRAEAMSEECLEIDVECAIGGEAAYDSDTINLETMDDDERRIELRPRRTRWNGVFDWVLVRIREIITEGEAQVFSEGEKTDDAGAESAAPASDKQD